MGEPSHPDELIANPGKYFDGPKDVLDRASLSRTRKLAILRSMELRAREQPLAPGTTSAASSSQRQQAIANAIRAVERDLPAKQRRGGPGLDGD